RPPARGLLKSLPEMSYPPRLRPSTGGSSPQPSGSLPPLFFSGLKTQLQSPVRHQAGWLLRPSPRKDFMDSQHLLAAFWIAAAPPAAVPTTSGGAEDRPAATTAAKTDVVTVKGKDYSLTVRTPEGWQADTETAKQYRATILFNQKAEAGGAKVMLVVEHKLDEN